MTFQPVIPAGGLLGWRFVQQTLPDQMEAFSKSPLNQRDTEYFVANIGEVETAEELVSDRRLLRVALGAFGLQDDINSGALIKKVLEDGTERPDALANRLADDRYAELSRAFGFGDAVGANTKRDSLVETVVSRFQASEFEVAVGQQDENMRLALNARRELEEIASRNVSENTKWYLVLGTPPLRLVFEKAFSLPSEFGQIDIEQQVEQMKDLMDRRLDVKDFSEMSDPEKTNDLVERFLLQSQINETINLNSSQSIALSLLRNGT